MTKNEKMPLRLPESNFRGNSIDMNKVKELAENNVVEAQNDLGAAYMTGKGVECNKELAMLSFMFF